MLKDNVSTAAYENIQKWLTESKYAEYREELQEMIDDKRWSDLEDAFFKVIEFGTAGRRGTTGIGSNRINRVTMGESAQALCEYALTFDANAADKGIAIACDTRLSSPDLSTYVATVCAANGFKTYVFDSYRSTPELSFAVRELGCAVGIVVSASHNPPADNGFKAYWSDGGQLVAPHDRGVLAVAEKVSEIISVDFDTAVSDGRIVIVGKEMDDRYIDAVVGQSEGTDRELGIVYSPLHGAGQRNTLPVLEKAGFSVGTVASQMTPDGHFPTIENGKPNPEERRANDRAVAQLLAERADIAITNDPDADRFGVIVRVDDRPVYLSGNQSAVLATDYTLRKKKEKAHLTGKEFVVKTIVTTDMIRTLAAAYGVKCYDNLLIGYKYIGELITKKEGQEQFLIGSEESFGLLKGDYARDKDGAAGALVIAEYAAELKAVGKTLYGRLMELYGEHGLFVERIDTVECPGANGFEQMKHIMDTLRTSPITEVDGETVTAVMDYQTLKKTAVSDGSQSDIDCINGNVLVLECNNDPRCRFTIRPSGTEPKLKIYTQWYQAADGDTEQHYERLQTHLEALGETLEGKLLAL